MKNKIIVVLTLVLLAVGLSGCTQQQTDPLDGLGYANNQYGFGMNPPGNWTKDTSGLMGTAVIFYAPNDDSLKENINIMSTELPSGTNLSGYAELVQNQLNSYLTDPTLISSGYMTANGMNAYGYSYNYTQGSYILKAKQVLVEKNSKLLIITYTADMDDYDTYEYGLDQCINSLIIV